MALALKDIDHIHVLVSDRPAAEAWYAKVLGLRRVPAFELWASDGGPLTIGNEAGTIHLALFDHRSTRGYSTVAFSVSGSDFLAWRSHLSAQLAKHLEVVDHEVSWSLYFADPDHNQYEVTSYDYEEIRTALAAAGDQPQRRGAA